MLIPGRFQRFVLEHFEKIRGLGKSRARRGRRPQARVMSGEVPAGRAAHRKPAHHEPVLVNRVSPPHALQHLGQIHFAGEPVRIAVTAIEVKDEGVRWSEFAGGL